MSGEERDSRELRTRRLILVVEDNELNREILTAMLEDEYDVITAEDGAEGLAKLAGHCGSLSLVLLDVYMPVMNGFEFLEKQMEDPMMSQIPVIVTTGSEKQEDEVKCLKLGASDFVTKPYKPEVVKARVNSIIKLKESVTTLSAVEYDEVSGLYTMQAFNHYVQGMLNSDNGRHYDLTVMDIQEFKLVNSVFGEKKGDEVLAYVGSYMKEHIPYSICARQGDKFYFLSDAAVGREESVCHENMKYLRMNAPVRNLKIKMGYYHDIDRKLPVSMLCDRVLMAISTIKDDFTRDFVTYDDNVRRKLLEDQRMESEFDSAIEKNGFVAWYQPKVDPRTGEMIAAEALVRWISGDGKMTPPDMFIPLFEFDGLISRLDAHIFEQVCRFQRKRMDEGRKVVPVSVNLSRNSIYQEGTVERYIDIVKSTGVPFELVPLELTESAATESTEIQLLTEDFNEAGFDLHMDDFGTGYSSLSGLTTMPFAVIKLDKSLIDKIGNSRGDTIIRHMIDIAHEMDMKVVAEGVEEAYQRDFLRDEDCDMIQGYYYSPPVKPERFEEMLDNGIM